MARLSSDSFGRVTTSCFLFYGCPHQPHYTVFTAFHPVFLWQQHKWLEGEEKDYLHSFISFPLPQLLTQHPDSHTHDKKHTNMNNTQKTSFFFSPFNPCVSSFSVSFWFQPNTSTPLFSIFSTLLSKKHHGFAFWTKFFLQKTHTYSTMTSTVSFVVDYRASFGECKQKTLTNDTLESKHD